MKCLECDSENLRARVTLDRDVPLALRNGAIKVGGMKVSQIDMKEAWEGERNGLPREIRGPINCFDCGTEHYYVVADKNPLRVGDTLKARLDLKLLSAELEALGENDE